MAEDLTQLVRQDTGSELAWDKWFRGIYPRVYYVIYGSTKGNRDLAEELVQVALEKFIEADAIEKVERDKDAAGYLIQIAKRLLIDRLRLHRNRHETIDAESVADDSRRSPDDDIVLQQISERLTEEENLLLSSIREGNSVREIAEVLRIGYSAAGVRVHRLREKMKELAESA